MSTDLTAILRRTGALDTLVPASQIRQLSSLTRAVDQTGAFVPDATDPFRTPLTMHWYSGSSGRQRAAQSGTAILLAAHAATPPAGGSCTCTLTMVTTTQGSTLIGTVSILQGESIGEIALDYPIPNGAWLSASVSNANGASGVSISLTLSLASGGDQ